MELSKTQIAHSWSERQGYFQINCTSHLSSTTYFPNLNLFRVNDFFLPLSHLATVCRVRTMASVCHCTRKTAMCAFAQLDLREKTAKQVKSLALNNYQGVSMARVILADEG